MRYLVQYYRDSGDPVARISPSYRAYIQSLPPFKQSEVLERSLEDINTLRHDLYVKRHGHDRYFQPMDMMDILRDVPFNPSTHRQQYFR